MIIVKYLLLSLLCAISLGCNQSPKENEVHYPQTLLPAGQLEFQLDETASFSPFSLQYLDDGQQTYLLASNKNMLAVDVYATSTGKLHARLLVNDSATRYTDDLHGFWAVSRDSIFTYAQHKYGSVLLKVKDWKVQARQNIKMNNARTQQPVLNHASMTALPTFYLNGRLHAMELPLANISKLIGTGYSLEHVYDLHTGQASLANTTWPQAYEGKLWDEFYFFCWTHDAQGRIIYSWEAEPDLLVREGEQLRRVPARCDRFKYEVEYDPSLKNNRGGDVNLIEQDHYALVLYDRYRQVYYRFAVLGVPHQKSDGEAQTVCDWPFAVITLDKNFKKIGETLFPPGRYQMKDSFVSREGLCISNHNCRRYEELSEDVMSFSVFKLAPTP
jgi:hypothetical protein